MTHFVDLPIIAWVLRKLIKLCKIRTTYTHNLFAVKPLTGDVTIALGMIVDESSFAFELELYASIIL